MSRRFSKMLAILPLMPFRLVSWLWMLESSVVTVMLNVPTLVMRSFELVYLLSLFNIGDGLTRKSRRDATIDEERIGNFSASLPRF